MSKTWIQNHIDKLIKQFPQKKEYEQIKKLVINDAYRGILWKMNEFKGKLVIDTKKVISKGSDLRVIDGISGDALFVQKSIEIESPINSFEKRLVDSYFSAIKNL